MTSLTLVSTSSELVLEADEPLVLQVASQVVGLLVSPAEQGPQGTPTQVNGKTGASITLDAADVGADPAGTAANALAAAEAYTYPQASIDSKDAAILAQAQAYTAQQLAVLTAGSPAQLDTFLETYNRFLSDESALSALTTLVGQKATLSALAQVATSGAYGDLSGRPALGDAAAKNTGTAAGTLAAGDDSRIAGALQASALGTALMTLFTALPTSLPASAGQLWLNGGVLSIS